MGQYFKPVNLDKQEFVSCYDYGHGAKLTEHSWLFNPMVNAIVIALAPGGNWHRNQLVWAGDYMDEGLFMGNIKGKKRKDQTLYDCCREESDDPLFACISKVRPMVHDGPVPEYIINHDLKEFVKLADLPEEDPEEPGWHLHPLPLLTCSGNGRGGGDFTGENAYIGTWAGHLISADYTAPANYGLVVPNFTEQRP